NRQEPFGRTVEGEPEPSAGEQAPERAIVGEQHAHRRRTERGGLDVTRIARIRSAAVSVASGEAPPILGVVRLGAAHADRLGDEPEVYAEVDPDPVVLPGSERLRRLLGIREVTHAVPALPGFTLLVFLALRRVLAGAGDAGEPLLALHRHHAGRAPAAHADSLLRSRAHGRAE